jgi:hypothetical protein
MRIGYTIKEKTQRLIVLFFAASKPADQDRAERRRTPPFFPTNAGLLEQINLPGAPMRAFYSSIE